MSSPHAVEAVVYEDAEAQAQIPLPPAPPGADGNATVSGLGAEESMASEPHVEQLSVIPLPPAPPPPPPAGFAPTIGLYGELIAPAAPVDSEGAGSVRKRDDADGEDGLCVYTCVRAHVCVYV